MRIGILGGTFNPVHVGHLVLAEAARQQCRLDQVWFIPTAIPPHKSPRGMAGGAARLAMVRLAIRGHAAFRACDVELRRGGISYTLDTMRALQHRHPRDRWFLIVGSDMLKARWYGLKELAQRCTFVVAERAGTSSVGNPAVADTSSPERTLPARSPARWVPARSRRLVAMPRLDISSSMIRSALRRGASVRYLVPEAVRRYLLRHRVYQRAG